MIYVIIKNNIFGKLRFDLVYRNKVLGVFI